MTEVEFKPFEAFSIRQGAFISAKSFVYIPGDIYDIKFKGVKEYAAPDNSICRYRLRLPTLVLMMDMDEWSDGLRVYSMQTLAIQSTARVELGCINAMEFVWWNSSPSAEVCLGKDYLTGKDIGELSHRAALWYLASTFTNDFGGYLPGAFWPKELKNVRMASPYAFMEKWEEMSRDGAINWDAILKDSQGVQSRKVIYGPAEVV